VSYELEFEDTFDGDTLDRARWLPYYLPHWSSRERAAARYALGDGMLELRIEAAQEPWCPEFDGDVRVSSLQTGAFSGPLGSAIGQHRFNPSVVVREEQPSVRLYTPAYGRVEARARATDDPDVMVAFWMIGYEDEPTRSAEICVFEIFGRDVDPDRAVVGMGVHPLGDPDIVDDFSKLTLSIDACAFHVYGADWTPDRVTFTIDGLIVKVVEQSPAYPMQIMLGIYAFSAPDAGSSFPKTFTVDHVRGYRSTAQ
jgi:hypothetical protein